jgi:hypothetical protein
VRVVSREPPFGAALERAVIRILGHLRRREALEPTDPEADLAPDEQVDAADALVSWGP